jgi:hypothetical protein
MGTLVGLPLSAVDSEIYETTHEYVQAALYFFIFLWCSRLRVRNLMHMHVSLSPPPWGVCSVASCLLPLQGTNAHDSLKIPELYMKKQLNK